MIYLNYDGSFLGFLTAWYYCCERNIDTSSVLISSTPPTDLFISTLTIESDNLAAKNVWSEWRKILDSNTLKDIYMIFLSENQESIQACFALLPKIIVNSTILKNLMDERVRIVNQTLTKVSRERHRMKAFVRFQKSKDDLYIARIEPDFNVLPLIISFFRNRFRDQKWLIFDAKRNYGIFYDLKDVNEVHLIDEDTESILPKVLIDLAPDELLYQNLWKDYFRATNIPSRKNLKLHIQHVPKRYWKHLIEKQA